MDCVGVFAVIIDTGISYMIAHYGRYYLTFSTAIPLVFLSLLIVRSLYLQIQKEKHWKTRSFPENDNDAFQSA